MNSVAENKRRRERVSLCPMQQHLTYLEAESLVKNLVAFLPEKVGSSEWLEQQQFLQTLKLQAHADIRCGGREHIKELFISHDKMSLLVVNLLVAEAWLDTAFSELESTFASNNDPLILYEIVQQELILSNLLEVFLHHRDAAQAITEDAAIELVDWAVRKLSWLTINGEIHAKKACKSSPMDMLQQSSQEEIRKCQEDTMFCTCMSGIAILHHLSDHSGALSLGIIHRMATEHDIGFSILTPLILAAPWEIVLSGDNVSRWENGEWLRLTTLESRRLGTVQTHAWLLLCNLLLDPIANSSMCTKEYHIEIMKRLRASISHTDLDQLPILASLQRYLDSASSGTTVTQPCSLTSLAASTGKLVIEQVPQLRQTLMKDTDWDKIINTIKNEYLDPEYMKKTLDQRMSSFLSNLDFCCEELTTEYGDEKQYSKDSGFASPLRLEVFSGPFKDTWTWHAGYRFSFDETIEPDDVEVKSRSHCSTTDRSASSTEHCHDATYKSKSFTIGNDKSVRGKRYRLNLMMQSGAKDLPSNGKVVLFFQDLSVEAVLELPKAETRYTHGLPSVNANLNEVGAWLEKKSEKTRELCDNVLCVHENIINNLKLSLFLLFLQVNRRFTEVFVYYCRQSSDGFFGISSKNQTSGQSQRTHRASK